MLGQSLTHGAEVISYQETLQELTSKSSKRLLTWEATAERGRGALRMPATPQLGEWRGQGYGAGVRRCLPRLCGADLGAHQWGLLT